MDLRVDLNPDRGEVWGLQHAGRSLRELKGS
jgi:hypothetical protein